MGADNFMDWTLAKDASEAFRICRKEAQYNYGHAGYTGTIAEKSGFMLIGRPVGVRARTVIDTLDAAYYGSPLVSDYDWQGQKIKKDTTAWDKLVKWYGRDKAERIIRTYNDKWGDAIAIEASPAERDEYIKKYVKLPVAVGGKAPQRVRGSVYYFAGWASS